MRPRPLRPLAALEGLKEVEDFLHSAFIPEGKSKCKNFFTDRPFTALGAGNTVSAMDVYEVRKRRLAEYIKEKYRGNRSAFCRATGEDNSYIARLYSDKPGQSKPFSETVARRIERSAGLGKDWLDRDERASDGQNLPVHVGNEISTTPNTTGGVNLSPDLIQIIKWYQGMGPRNRARAMAQLHLWYLDDTQEDERPALPGVRVFSDGRPIEQDKKGHRSSNRKTVK